MNKVLKDSLSLTVSTVIVKLLGLIYKIPIANLLGDEGMGYFNTAYTVYAFFYLLCTAGVPKAVMILASKSGVSEENKRRILLIALRAYLILGGAVSILFMLLSGWLSKIIGNSEAAATMLAIAPSILFVSLGGVIRGYLSARSRLMDIAVSQIVEGVGRLALGLCFALIGLRLGYSLPIICAFAILGVSIGALLGFLYLAFCSKNEIFGEKTGQSVKTKEFFSVMKALLRISLPITMSAAVMSITGLIDLGMIMRGLLGAGYSESYSNALYGNYTTLAVPMFNLATSLIAPISVAIIPSMTAAYGRHDRAEYSEILTKGLSSAALIAAPISVGLAAYRREILSMLFGKSGVEIGADLLLVLIPAIVFSSWLIILNSALEAAGHFYAPVISMLIGSAAKIAVGYFLIRKPHIGIFGAPIGTVICYAVALCVSVCIYYGKVMESLQLFRTSWMQAACAICSVMTSRLVFGRISSIFGSIASLIICIGISALLYAIFIAMLGLINDKKDADCQNIQIANQKIIE